MWIPEESRQLPIQPIGQHKVTSDAVGWYPGNVSIAQRADGSFDPIAIDRLILDRLLIDDYPSPREVYVTLRGVSCAV